MKKKFFFLLIAFFIQRSVFACGGLLQWVYAGDIAYSLDSTNPLNCSIVVTLEFDIPDNLSTDNILINWGDGNITSIGAISITADSVSNSITGTSMYYKHVYAGNHVYAALPDSGFYIISPVNQFRVNGISNVDEGTNASTPYYIEALVNTDSAVAANNSSPVFANPFQIQFATALASFSEPQTIDSSANGDSITFDLATPLMDHDLPVDEYLSPEGYCEQFNGNASFTLNHQTGEIIWTAPCVQGVFAITEVVSRFRNGHLLGSVIRDQMIYVASEIINSIPDVLKVETVDLFPNPATDILGGTLGSVDLNSVSLQITSVDGSVLMKDIPVTENKFSVDVSSLSAGVYFLSIKDNNQSVTKRFIKE